jgi:primosomal protein N' (replication factor Y) (superfamily II helicase)
MYAEVVLPIKIIGLGNSLTYKIPNPMENQVNIGSAVRVSVRNRTYTGIIQELHERVISFTAKDILSSKEGGAMLSSWQLELANWVKDYYYSPLYKVLKIMLPKKVWQEKSNIPYEIYYQRTELARPEKLGKKQDQLIKLFDQEKIISRKTLREFTLNTLQSLEKKGLIKQTKGEIRTLQIDEIKSNQKTLTQAQQSTIENISKSSQKKFLIHGVTGSGKTEIYLHLAKNAIEKNQQAIILVPEISLTPQLIDYFSNTFKGQLAVLHSKLSLGEREREWWRIQTGAAKVVIGSRSAIFAPAKNIGLIIMDEEHEWSYKQDKTPYYHARDIAFKISELTGAKVVMGSATPSIEMSHAAETGLVERFMLNKRINKSESLPPVHLADMRQELQKKNYSIFSDLLDQKIKSTLEAKEQIILFLNRRGHASAVLCRDCGYTSTCDQCDVSLTYHRFRNGAEQLVCHHCSARHRMPATCPECKGGAIKFIGLGTQRVEEELTKRFPSARILRADRDTTLEKNSFKKMYRDMKNHNADILIGTQMVSKGLDLPNVTLVGVMMADIGLHIPDFRASERGFQLLTQVAGRSGRAEKPGQVVIQTYNPEHPSLQHASNHDYSSFYDEEILIRKQFNTVPFSRIIKMTFKNIDQKICTTEAEALSQKLSTIANKHEINCAPALIPRKHNKYRWHVYIQGKNPQSILNELIARSPLKEGWSIDVDPVTMS